MAALGLTAPFGGQGGVVVVGAAPVTVSGFTVTITGPNFNASSLQIAGLAFNASGRAFVATSPLGVLPDPF